jgi:hypothetical protein
MSPPCPPWSENGGHGEQKGQALNALGPMRPGARCRMATVKDEIARRFELNLGRAKSLVAAYEVALPGASGRPRVATTDILRGSVVFLHASLEDLLRSVLGWKLPSAPSKQLEDVPLVGTLPRTKYTLGDIAAHRGATVDELIGRSVAASLERSNFNDVAEVAHALARSGIPTAVVDPYGSRLAAMMTRRHWIVHRADRNQAQGSGQFAAQSLAPDLVRTWIASVEAFGAAVLALL